MELQECDNTSKHNEYYRVDNKHVPIAFWHIVYNVWDDPQTKDRNAILIYGLGSLSLVFVLIIIRLLIMKWHVVKIENESAKERLLRLCHPNNFMHPFDKERIEKANRLYSLISNLEDDNQIMLRELINEAIQELGIHFIKQDMVASLKNKCNPQKYMNPYNEEKVARATELYAILSKDNLTYDDVCLVEEKVKDLL